MAVHRVEGGWVKVDSFRQVRELTLSYIAAIYKEIDEHYPAVKEVLVKQQIQASDIISKDGI